MNILNDIIEKIISEIGIPILVLLLAFGFFLAVLGFRALRNRAISGKAGMIGLVGVVKEPRTYRGFILVETRGELWWASCDRTLREGQEVYVTAIKNMILTVRPLDNS